MIDHHIYEMRHTYWAEANRVRDAMLPHHVASCEGDSLAFALGTLVEEGQLTSDSQVGILYRPEDAEGPGGVWLVNPWAVGRTRWTV